MEAKHLDLAEQFVSVAEKTRDSGVELGAGDIIIALATALGFFTHYRNHAYPVDTCRR